MELSEEEKKILLKAARNSIGTLFNGGELPTIDYKKYPRLESKAGAFVTLTIEGNLRGCIGYIIGYGPLFKTVCDAAIQAATNDPRFFPLTEEEFRNVEIEVSVLSEPFPMKSYDDIVIGKHGLILEESGRRGLLLPQVPVEYNMDRDQYLTSLCQKAGFPGDCWRGRTLNISMFTANVFSEKDFKG
jgi:AmmeMemoRadiSam system protein A